MSRDLRANYKTLRLDDITVEHSAVELIVTKEAIERAIKLEEEVDKLRLQLDCRTEERDQLIHDVNMANMNCEDVVDQLKQTEAELSRYYKALELACKFIDWDQEGKSCPKSYSVIDEEVVSKCANCDQEEIDIKDCWHEWFLQQADEALREG